MKNSYFLILIFLSVISSAQQIVNVQSEQQGKKVVITYDITGAQKGQTFDVKVFYSQNGNNWNPITKGLSGAVGANINAGAGKQITWDVLQDENRLVGKGFMLKVKATVGGGFSGKSSTFTDRRDGQEYKYIKIGSQTWMAQNLNYLTSDGSWCYNNSQDNCVVYGRLYNLETATKVCPSGWHLPSDGEWTTLTDYLRGKDIGDQLKEAGTSHWASRNNGTNSSGFGALPGGTRYDDGTYFDIGSYGYWWSSQAYGAATAWSRYLSCSNSQVNRFDGKSTNGFSVRCVRDF